MCLNDKKSRLECTILVEFFGIPCLVRLKLSTGVYMARPEDAGAPLGMAETLIFLRKILRETSIGGIPAYLAKKKPG